MIPKKVHQIFFNLNNKEITDIPIFFESSISTMRKYKDYEYRLWREKDCEKLIENKLPQYYDFYINMKYKIQQIDFMRYAILYLFGGVYIDLDILPIKKFNFHKNKLILYTFNKIIQKHNEFVQNDLMATEPLNPFFWMLLHRCERNYKAKEKIDVYKNWKARFVLQTTGPRYFSKTLKHIYPAYRPLENLVYTEWKNAKPNNKKDYFFANYVTGGWLESMSNNKASKNFYLKIDEL